MRDPAVHRAFGLLALLAGAISGAAWPSTLTGTVRDPSGKAEPNAFVTSTRRTSMVAIGRPPKSGGGRGAGPRSTAP